MNKWIYIISALFVCFLILYKIFTIVYFIRLKTQLKDGDINTFTEVLGDNYKYRRLLSGLVRYKWSNGWMIIKANFDENGQLICTKIMPQIIFRLRSELLFIHNV